MCILVRRVKEIKLLSKIPWVDMAGTVCMQGLLKWIMDDGDVWNERPTNGLTINRNK